jgi:hypothetical protein
METSPSFIDEQSISMKIALSLILLIGCLAFCSCLQAEGWQISLNQYGYIKPPSRGAFPEGSASVSRYLDFDGEGNIVAGLVTRNPDQQSDTLEFSSRTWRTLVFDRNGKLLAKNDIPTRSWHENALYASSGGALLIRTVNRLRLISREGKPLAERSLALIDANGHKTYWRIYPFPNHHSLLLSEADSLEFLNPNDLTTVTRCIEDRAAASASDNRVLFRSYVRSPTGEPRETLRLKVKRFCGELDFAFDVKPTETNPFYASLLSDSTVILAGSEPTVVVHDKGREQWRDSFDRKRDSVDERVRGNESGTVFAVLVKTWAGGSKFFDTNSHLKALRIIVYAAKDGKRLLEVPITPLSSSILDFAISMDGKYLAITSDGELQLIQIP